MDGTITIDDLRQYEHELEAALEALHIARAKHEHDRDTQIMMIADEVVAAARRTGDATLLAAHEQTIKYSPRGRQDASDAGRTEERVGAGSGGQEGRRRGLSQPPAQGQPGSQPHHPGTRVRW